MASFPLSGLVSITLEGVFGPAAAWTALLVRGVTNDLKVMVGDEVDRLVSDWGAGRTIRILLLVSTSPSLRPLSRWCLLSEEVDDGGLLK